MITKLILYQGNDQTIQLTGVADANGNPISNAVVTGTLTDMAGVDVVGFVDEAFTPDVTTAGNYDLAVPADLAAEVGSYTLEIDGTTSEGAFNVYVPTEVQKRDP